tara:strand:+ start:370 stop:663 length:294 start_codon:yes stop_codon:yes gene_type:complete
MEKNKETNYRNIQPQNNQYEIERECLRLEKLFYFFRDFEKRVQINELEERLGRLEIQNTLLLKDVVELNNQEKSLFMKRLDQLWYSFTTRNNSKLTK